MMTTTILLGAGASKSAGVPISAELTTKLLEQIDNQSQALLHFVYGGLLMQVAARAKPGGYSQRPIVDAEDLFNAVEALANRASFEAAPFVTSWHPLISQIDQYIQGDLERQIKQGLDQLLSPSAPSRLARTLASAINGTAGNYRFRQVATDMISALKELLAVRDPSRIEYLAPLLELHRAQDGGLLIATLNYDMLIEQVGDAHSVQVDDGLDLWQASGFIKRPNVLTLLKLHGSIDWVQDENGLVRRATAEDRMQPALIFGGINKLRADGPYLEMLMEWRSHLDECAHLIIIGYSLRDVHVNAIIERWHRRDNLKRVTIIDPGYNERASSLGMYLWQLSNESLAALEWHEGRRPPRLEAPVQIIKDRAEEVLPTLFTRISQWPGTSTDRPASTT
jgi:hypothetical protein